MSNLQYEQDETLGSRVELYLFETEDGRYKWGYITDRVARSFNTNMFVPGQIKRGELRQQAGDSNAEKLTITVPYDYPVAVLHVPYLPPRPVKVTIYSYQRNDPMSEVVQGFVGYVTAFSQKGEEAQLECSQIIDALSQIVPWVTFKGDCVWALYGIGCGVSKGLYASDVTNVNTVVGEKITAPIFASMPDGWFTNGFISNPDTGEQRFISKHIAAEGAVYLVYPLLDYNFGALVAYAGCDRKRGTCETKFNNKTNYLGFDHNPTYNVFQQGVT